MLSKDDILAIINSELSLSDSSTYNGQGNVSLEDSLSYYLGQTPAPSQDGRSSVISTDVADSIEWILPQIMKSFTENNEVVMFDPVHEGDEKQAELESQYVYEVLMKQNDGFILLHQFIKDALMQRNGVLKVYYAEKNTTSFTNYTGITEQQLDQLLSTEGVEVQEQYEYIDDRATQEKRQVIEASLQQVAQNIDRTPPHARGDLISQMMQLNRELETPVMLYDVELASTRTKGRIYIDPVPPEEFRLNAQHNSINLDGARFTAHVSLKSVSDIIEEFDISLDEASELPEGANYYDREYRFSMQNESVFYDRVDSGDESQRLIEVSECFLQMDIDETGRSKLMKITVAGGDAPTDLLKVEQIESMPWVATTTFLMSHKFQGLSITDRLRQIQDQKTALWRNMMDNMYLQNNQRNVVIEGQVNLDDLLTSRVGGIVRAKRLDAITPLVTPQLGEDAYNMMGYLDKVRAGRTGVDPDGSASPASIGDRVGSQGVERLMNAKEELVGLIIRVTAEVGIKPLCTKIRDLSVRHIDSVVDFRFRGHWQKINPTDWMDRTSCTVRVGTGTGNRNEQIQAITTVIAWQERIISLPGQYILDPQQVYTALDDYCKFTGLNGATRYFTDPSSPAGQQKKQEEEANGKAESDKQDKLEQAMAKSQLDLSQAEQSKAQAQMFSAQSKAQAEQAKNELALQKQHFDSQMNMLKQELEEAKAIAADMGQTATTRLKKYDIDQRTALELTRIEAQSQSDENDNFDENKETTSG